MIGPSNPAQDAWRRLYPYSWLVTSIGPTCFLAIALTVPALVVDGEPGSTMGRLMAFVPIALGGLGVGYVVQRHYEYRIADGELVVRQGILKREERRIPLGRIHEMDVAQGPLQRLLGVGVLRVQTAGGAEPEAVMRVVELSEVERLRRQVGLDEGAPEASDAPSEAEEGVLLRMPGPEIVRLGLIRNQAWGLVGAVAVLLSQMGLFDLLNVEEMVEEAVPAVSDADPQQAIASMSAMAAERLEPALVISLAGAGLAGLVLLAVALSVLLSFLRFQGFELTAPAGGRAGTRLRARFGLLVRIAQATPTSRIQRLCVTDGLRSRLMSRRMIRMDTAGGEDGAKGTEGFAAIIASGSRHWLAPLIPAARVDGLLRRAMPECPRPEDARWQPIDPRARGRRLRLRAAVVVTGLAVVSVLVPWALAAVLPALGVLYWQAHRFTASRAWAAEADVLLWRRGWWRRELILIPYSRIQSATVDQSPLDRRHAMASVRVDVAGTSGIGARIPYLDVSAARGLAARLNREASLRAFDWD